MYNVFGNIDKYDTFMRSKANNGKIKERQNIT